MDVARDSAPAYGSEDELIADLEGFVRGLARPFMRRKLHCVIDFDDLLQIGSIALVNAWRTWDRSRGTSFHSYAAMRIRGDIIDEIRRSRWPGRRLQKVYCEIAENEKQLAQSLYRPPTLAEQADGLNLSINALAAILTRLDSSTMVSTETIAPANDDQCPHTLWLQAIRYGCLTRALDKLPARQRLVIRRKYFEGHKQRDIAKDIERSEPRTAQIHQEALRALHRILRHQIPMQ